MIGLTIALPFCDRLVMPEWAVSLSIMSYPTGLNRQLVTARNMRQSQEWLESVIKVARKNGSKYIWILHDDVEAPPITPRKLIYDLEQNPDAMIAAGIYCVKDLPTEPTVYKGSGHGAFWDWKLGEVFDCDAIGDGCMMIRTSVFDKIEKPWFKYEESYHVDTHEVGDVSEDFFFCRKVREAGFRILADGEIVCKHWDVEKQCSYNLPEGCYPLTNEAELVENE